jgi:hypothetical protein
MLGDSATMLVDPEVLVRPPRTIEA